MDVADMDLVASELLAKHWPLDTPRSPQGMFYSPIGTHLQRWAASMPMIQYTCMVYRVRSRSAEPPLGLERIIDDRLQTSLAPNAAHSAVVLDFSFVMVFVLSYVYV